jgi:hypothetical protein
MAVVLFGTKALAHPPTGIVADKNGNVYFIRNSMPRLVRVDPEGKLTKHRLLHNGRSPGKPHRLAIDKDGNLYMLGSGTVWRVTPKESESGRISLDVTVRSLKSFRTRQDTSFLSKTCLAVDSKGIVYFTQISDRVSWSQILSLDPQDNVRVVAGGKNLGQKDGKEFEAGFQTFVWSGMACGPDDAIYIPDHATSIRRVTHDGQVTTLAGSTQKGFADGKGSRARFRRAAGIDVDKDGNVYVADELNRAIRKVTPEGVVTTIAGNGQEKHADGPALEASFAAPTGVAVGPNNELYVLDMLSSVNGNKMWVCKLAEGEVSTVAETNYHGP